MKFAVVLLALIAGSYAAPKAIGKGDDCNSGYCDALENLYRQIPSMLDEMKDEVCQEVADILGDGGFGELIKRLCLEIINLEEPSIIAAIREQIKQQGSADDCNFGSRKRRSARDGNDCDNSPYCEALKQVYDNMPEYVGEFEDDVCSIFPTAYFQHQCELILDQVKGPLVAAFRQQIQQQGEEFGCDDLGSG